MEKKYDYTWLKSLGDIQELCDDVVEKYRRVEEENKRLHEENGKLMSGVWKEEHCAKLMAEYEKMQNDYFRGFPISEEDEKKINEFKEKYKGKKYGAIGGAFTYQFTPTSIGVSGVIIGPDGKEFEFQEIG